MRQSAVPDPDAVPDGTVARLSLDVVPLADGSVLRVPVIVVAGHGTRPRLVCVAGIHGDEPEGMRALLALADELDPATLRGRLVLVPVANPPAFAAVARSSPLDGLDLNRIFPGRADGRPSEQLAHRLLQTVLLGADFVFSLHSWSASGEVIPYVEYGHAITATAAASLRAAKAAGFDLIRISHWAPGLMTRVVNEAGIPGIEAEIGGLGIATEHGTSRYKAHVRALLAHLGMQAGDPPQNRPRIVAQFELATSVGGILMLQSSLGDELAAGALLARVCAPDGTLREEIGMPRAGLLAALRRHAAVLPGETIARLFHDASDPLAGETPAGTTR